jgi:rhodanese-related sulfurtransferase
MAAEHYDALAKVLRELPDRFGPAVFADRRRVVSMLSDRVPEARREIKVLGSAIDDGVFDTLTNARSEQIGLEIDRLAARFETNHGVRSDIALPVVRACAYGLGRGPLPSEYGPLAATGQAPVGQPPQDGSWVGVSAPVGVMAPAGAHSAPIPRHQADGSWVGVSTPAGAPQGAAPQQAYYSAPAPHYGAPPGYSQQVGWPGGPGMAPAGVGYPAGPMAPPAKGGAAKWVVIGAGAVVAVLVGLYIIGSQSPTPPTKPTPSSPPPTSSGPPSTSTPSSPPRPQPPESTSPKTADPGPVTKPEREPTSGPTAKGPTTTGPGSTTRPPAGGYADEARDWGVAPQRTLQSNIGSPTPTGLPAGIGRVLSTQALDNEMRKGTDFLLIDVLEAPHQRTIIKARYIAYAGRAGSFSDLVQQQVTSELGKLTGGRVDYPIVFFCQGPLCWESYNAVLRAYEAGYRNLYWYRGGLAAWSAAGLQMQPLPSR